MNERRFSRRRMLGLLGATTVAAVALPLPGSHDEAGAASLRPALGISIGSGEGFYNSADAGLSQFQRMAASGITRVRIDAPDYGGYNTGRTYNDAIVRAAISAGLDPLLIIDDYFDAAGPADFAAFATDLVSYYAPLGVHSYEVLNEANLSANWNPGSSSVNPAAYVDLLGRCYSAIHAADPQARVVFSGLAGNIGDGPSQGNGNYYAALSAITFVRLAYEAMGGRSSGYFDVMSQHPYGYPAKPSATSGPFHDALANGSASAPSVRYLMRTNGDASKPIWVTEFGAPTGSLGGYTPVSQSLQATMFTDAFRIIAANNWAWVTDVFAYKWYDDAPSDTHGDDFGLTGTAAAGYPAKPALAAFLLG